MPWTTPTLKAVRSLNRDNVTAQLRSGPMIPNSVLRVMADSNAAVGYLVLLYIDWLSEQLLPDTAEDEWLVRWANIKNVPVGNATYASGTITVNGIEGTPVPQGTLLTAQTGSAAGGPQTVTFQVMAATTVGDGPTAAPISALTAGETGLEVGASLGFVIGISGINGAATLATITDGVDAETETELRANVLDVLRQPPMGGDANDYVQWAKQFPGVTRAWCSPREMGIGTVTLRFMMDNDRATSNLLTNGFPTSTDVAALQTYLDAKRPVTVLDCYVEAPLPEPISFTLYNLDDDTASTLANITASVTAMLFAKGAPAFALNGVAQPAQTIFAVWVSDAVFQAVGVNSFDLTMSDHPMPTPGSLAVLGNILLG